MNALDTLKSAVAAEKTVADSLVALIRGLAERLRNAVTNGDEADLLALADDVEAETQALAAAVVENTVPDPTAE